MKQLMVVRHAKAGWGDPSLADFQRPLNERGISDSLVMAQHLLDKSIVPHYIVSSPALRALTTAKQFAKTLGIKTAGFATDKCIYEANSDTLLDIVWGLDDRHDKIMLVGHNPGLSDMVRLLVAQNVDELSTCEVIAIQFDCDQWQKIDLRSGTTFFNVTPQK